MAEDPIPSAEPEISAPPPTALPSPARPDPGMIDGEATEIRDEAAATVEAPSADAPPPAPNRAAPYAIPAAAGLGGAILGAALALLAAWLIDPRAGALDDDLGAACLAALEIPRVKAHEHSLRFTWRESARQFLQHIETCRAGMRVGQPA